MTDLKTHPAIGSGDCSDDAELNDEFIEEVCDLVVAGGQDATTLRDWLTRDPLKLDTYIRFRDTWLYSDDTVRSELRRLLDLYIVFFTKIRGMTPSAAIVTGERW